jgi:hypothetical protein
MTYVQVLYMSQPSKLIQWSKMLEKVTGIQLSLSYPPFTEHGGLLCVHRSPPVDHV